jgi:hypothetical protein
MSLPGLTAILDERDSLRARNARQVGDIRALDDANKRLHVECQGLRVRLDRAESLLELAGHAALRELEETIAREGGA